MWGVPKQWKIPALDAGYHIVLLLHFHPVCTVNETGTEKSYGTYDSQVNERLLLVVIVGCMFRH